MFKELKYVIIPTQVSQVQKNIHIKLFTHRSYITSFCAKKKKKGKFRLIFETNLVPGFKPPSKPSLTHMSIKSN